MGVKVNKVAVISVSVQLVNGCDVAEANGFVRKALIAYLANHPTAPIDATRFRVSTERVITTETIDYEY